MRGTVILTSILLAISFCAQAQEADSLVDKIVNFPNRLFSKIKNKTAGIDEALSKKTEKYIEKLAKRERALQKKIADKDSLLATTLFQGTQERYQYYIQKIRSASTKATSLTGKYLPNIDSLTGTLSFLANNKKLLNANPELLKKLSGSIDGLSQLQSRLEVSNEIKAYISQRKQQLRQTLKNYSNLNGVKKYLDDYNKQAYYYSQQVKEYREMLNDPDKLEKKALLLLNKLPVFQSFMKQHSMLASLFNLSGAGVDGPGAVSQGMPTRSQIESLIQNQVGTSGPSVGSLVQKNVQSAQGAVDKLRDKLNSYGDGADLDMPNFKPNSQKTKTFLQRLEYGSNLQTAKSNNFFPTTTDIALSVGYKLNNKSIIGVGASYKVGWGSDIKHINISSQGAGIRSYLDMQVKKTFYASGGFEYNYQQPFNSINVLGKLNSWQQSGLLGISKIVSLKTKMLKKSKVQFLWDFLSYQQIPRTQPFKFRVGYSF
jgi:hypothetical protein